MSESPNFGALRRRIIVQPKSLSWQDRKPTSRELKLRRLEVHRQVLLEVLGYAAGAGWQVCGLIASPLLGPKGNREFLVWLQPGEAAGQVLEPWIQGVLV